MPTGETDEDIRERVLEIARSTDPNEDLPACFAVTWGTELLATRARIADIKRERDEAWSELKVRKDRIATLSRDLAEARAKLGQAWEEGAREGYRLHRVRLADLIKQNPHALMVLANAPAGEKER